MFCLKFFLILSALQAVLGREDPRGRSATQHFLAYAWMGASGVRTKRDFDAPKAKLELAFNRKREYDAVARQAEGGARSGVGLTHFIPAISDAFARFCNAPSDPRYALFAKTRAESFLEAEQRRLRALPVQDPSSVTPPCCLAATRAVQEAIGLAEQGRLRKAIEVLTDVMDAHPTTAEVHPALAHALLRAGRVDGAWGALMVSLMMQQDGLEVPVADLQKMLAEVERIRAH